MNVMGVQLNGLLQKGHKKKDKLDDRENRTAAT